METDRSTGQSKDDPKTGQKEHNAKQQLLWKPKQANHHCPTQPLIDCASCLKAIVCCPALFCTIPAALCYFTCSKKSVFDRAGCASKIAFYPCKPCGHSRPGY